MIGAFSDSIREREREKFIQRQKLLKDRQADRHQFDILTQRERQV